MLKPRILIKILRIFVPHLEFIEVWGQLFIFHLKRGTVVLFFLPFKERLLISSSWLLHSNGSIKKVLNFFIYIWPLCAKFGMAKAQVQPKSIKHLFIYSRVLIEDMSPLRKKLFWQLCWHQKSKESVCVWWTEWKCMGQSSIVVFTCRKQHLLVSSLWRWLGQCLQCRVVSRIH